MEMWTYEVVDLVKPDPMKENVMLTYKSGKGFDAKDRWNICKKYCF